ncbi:MAG: ABC transporter substrate-binding protein [Planctomycetota bacterium]
MTTRKFGPLQLITGAIALLVAIAFVQFMLPKPPVDKTMPTIRVGWQTAWATAGQIIQTLVHTNILDRNKVQVQFQSFLYGPDMNEAALAGAVDCVNTGVVPATNLLAANDDWIIVARLIDFPVSTIVGKETGISTYNELRGKTIGVPFGGGSHPYLLHMLKESSLTWEGTNSDVKLINLKPSEHLIALKQGSIDAVATWEPTASILASEGGIKIDEARHVGFVVVRKSFAAKNPELIVNLLVSYIEANFFVANHRQESDDWFADVSKYDPKLIRRITILEKNTKAQSLSDVSITVGPEDIALAQQVADTMFDSKLIPRKVQFQERVTDEYVTKAYTLVSASTTKDKISVKD